MQSFSVSSSKFFSASFPFILYLEKRPPSFFVWSPITHALSKLLNYSSIWHTNYRLFINIAFYLSFGIHSEAPFRFLVEILGWGLEIWGHACGFLLWFLFSVLLMEKKLKGCAQRGFQVAFFYLLNVLFIIGFLAVAFLQCYCFSFILQLGSFERIRYREWGLSFLEL